MARSKSVGERVLKKYLPAALIATVTILLSAACTGAAQPSAHSQTNTPAAINAPAAIAASPAAPAGPPAHPKFESTGLNAGWTDPETGFNISNDMWNCPQAACGRQEVWANSSGDWGVVSTMAKGNTAVLVYPAVQQQFGANQPALLGNASELVSTFTEAMPTTAGTIGEAAYDIWLNDWNTEVMIWVDNQHQTFYQPLLGTATFGGQQFRIYMDHGVSHGYPSGPVTCRPPKTRSPRSISAGRYAARMACRRTSTFLITPLRYRVYSYRR